LVGQPGKIPNFPSQAPFDKASLMMNFQGARRKAAIWVDNPLNYEYQLLLDKIGVLPFPGMEALNGVAPLHVYGGFISQRSAAPLAMWEWLKFLSHQRPIPRLIPARPSVAKDTNFWGALPPDLGNAMLLAFPRALAIPLREQAVISWALVDTVSTGDVTSLEAVAQRLEIQWFYTAE